MLESSYCWYLEKFYVYRPSQSVFKEASPLEPLALETWWCWLPVLNDHFNLTEALMTDVKESLKHFKDYRDYAVTTVKTLVKLRDAYAKGVALERASLIADVLNLKKRHPAWINVVCKQHINACKKLYDVYPYYKFIEPITSADIKDEVNAFIGSNKQLELPLGTNQTSSEEVLKENDLTKKITLEEIYKYMTGGA